MAWGKRLPASHGPRPSASSPPAWEPRSPSLRVALLPSSLVLASRPRPRRPQSPTSLGLEPGGSAWPAPGHGPGTGDRLWTVSPVGLPWSHVPPSLPRSAFRTYQAPAFPPVVALSSQDPSPPEPTSLGPSLALGTPRPRPRTRWKREMLGASLGGMQAGLQVWQGAVALGSPAVQAVNAA